MIKQLVKRRKNFIIFDFSLSPGFHRDRLSFPRRWESIKNVCISLWTSAPAFARDRLFAGVTVSKNFSKRPSPGLFSFSFLRALLIVFLIGVNFVGAGESVSRFPAPEFETTYTFPQTTTPLRGRLLWTLSIFLPYLRL